MTEPRRLAHRQATSRAVTPLSLILSILYGLIAAFVFCFSGSFGTFGQALWRDIALLVVTVAATASLTYISLLLIAYGRRPAVQGGDPSVFEWHLLVPCRDEESVIAATVSAARTSFPNVHVWVIDDDSEDATAQIVRELMDFDVRVHLISRVRPAARTGKGDALNTAYEQVAAYVDQDSTARERVIIGVLDADGFLSENALELLAGPDGFDNAEIGAAQLEVWMKNRADRKPRPQHGWLRNILGRYLIRMQDIEFRTSNSAMQLLRVQTGTVGMGGNGQFTRLTVLDALTEHHGKPWGRKLSEDYELGLNILSLGYRNHYVRQAHVSQEALPYFRRLLTQRTRWAQGIMECASNLPALRRSGTMSSTGFLEVHYFMSQPWIMMLNLLLIPVLLVLAVLDGSIGSLTDTATTVTALAGLAVLVLPYALWGPLYRRWGPERQIGFLSAVGLGLGYLVYVYFTYIYYPRAIYRMVTGRTSWAKTRRNADDLQPTRIPVPALERLPLLDVDELAELAAELGGHDEYAFEVVSAYAVMWPTRLANLTAAVAAENSLRARDAIGSIQVSSTMIGARRLAFAAEAFAELVDQGDFDIGRRALDAMTTIGGETVAEIRKRFSDELPTGRH